MATEMQSASDLISLSFHYEGMIANWAGNELENEQYRDVQYP
jgi:hypothetical protein